MIFLKNYGRILDMKQFRKRTIALVLASVITVAGSFAAGNYKNSLMALKFATNENGAVNMSVETKISYTGNVTPAKRDANTYILTLSEMDNKVPQDNINLAMASGNIQSVEIKTLPYTNNAKGYTRVIIKTSTPIKIIGENKIFIPSNEPAVSQAITTDVNNQTEEIPVQQVTKPRVESPNIKPENTINQEENIQDKTNQPVEVQEKAPIEPPKMNKTTSRPQEQSGEDAYNALLIVCGLFLLLCVIAFLAVKAQNKLQEITGEKLDIDTSDEEIEKSKSQKESKRKQIKNAINKLDSAYAKTAVPQPTQPVKTAKPAEELNVVDLDELFKEQQEKSTDEIITDIDDENAALDEFLSGFSFEELEEEPQEEETAGYDEEYYEKIINENNIKFSNEDIACIEQLLNSEINDSTLQNIEKYAVSNPIKKTPSRQEILEDLVATYSISHNISFTQDDIIALQKLINVEIDKDFITDLRTNPERTKEMQKEIESAKPKHRKPSEILTLRVKDMLPDLSEALRKQGGRKIESEVKPITVYASEGYEVSTLSLKDKLPDLSIEINNENAYISKPSANIELVDNSYEVETLSLKDELPDLAEALKHPEQFEAPEPEPVVIDEEALLKNISNVQFKPFYDGSETFEVLNDFESTPSMNDIQNEFNQFGNFEISEEDEEIPADNTNNDYDDFESLYSNEYFDLDNLKPAPAEEKKPEPKQKAEPKVSEKRTKSKLSEDLLKKIEATKAERLARREKITKQKQETKHTPAAAKQQPEIKCIFEGETYNIVSTAEFTENTGCHLAKNENGYVILGYIDKTLIKIKQFNTLKSERIAARLSEKLPNGISRYIVRIGLNKFVLNVTDNNIEYIMAL